MAKERAEATRNKGGNRGRENEKGAVSMWSIGLVMWLRASPWNQGKNEVETGEHERLNARCGCKPDHVSGWWAARHRHCKEKYGGEYLNGTSDGRNCQEFPDAMDAREPKKKKKVKHAPF